jgi:hypothetical protein
MCDYLMMLQNLKSFENLPSSQSHEFLVDLDLVHGMLCAKVGEEWTKCLEKNAAFHTLYPDIVF